MKSIAMTAKEILNELTCHPARANRLAMEATLRKWVPQDAHSSIYGKPTPDDLWPSSDAKGVAVTTQVRQPASPTNESTADVQAAILRVVAPFNAAVEEIRAGMKALQQTADRVSTSTDAQREWPKRMLPYLAAEYVQRDEATLRNWRKQGLPFEKVGRNTYYLKKDIDAFLGAHRQGGLNTADLAAEFLTE